jgi:glycosyltransferase involved in cell wall biosynthesis
VIIYASNKTSPQWVQHVKHRTFTDWVETNKKDWNLLQFIPNKYPSKNDSGDDPTTSFADFYIFGNKNVVSKFKSEKISVLVPVYNAEKYLRQCLDSIVNQAYKNVEIICVNDASTDNSLEILDEYAKKDDRIIIVNKRANEGSSQARKTGFEHSNGKYILPVDSDDYIEPDMLEKLHHCAVFGNYDIVCCGYFENRENYIRPFNPQVFPENKIDRIRCGIFGFGNAKVVWNKLAKYEIYKTIKFPKENNGEDCFITAQLFYRADRIGFYPLPLYHWQFNENSMTNNKLLAKKRYEDRKMNYEHIIEFCREKFGDDLSIFEPELSRRMADIEKQEPKKEMYLCQK